MDSQHWYVVYVRSRYEKKVHQLLQEKGIESSLPLIKTVRIWSDRKKKVEVPLFKGYVFVYIDIQKDGKKYCRKVIPNTYGGFRNWKYKHGCDLTDEQTGIKVESKWWKSHNGSVKHAAEDLVRKLIANGHL